MLKTGRKCTWEEIEVGEVFVWDSGDMTIMSKIPENSALELANDDNNWCIGDIFPFGTHPVNKYYKLPKSVQRLWKCE